MQLEAKETRLAYIYSAVLAILPALNVYKSPISRIELGTFLMLVLFVFMFIYSGWKVRADTDIGLWIGLLFLFFISTLISTSMLNLSSSELRTIVFRYLKIVAVVVIVVIYGRDYFRRDTAIKVMRVFCMSSIAFLAIQTVAYNVFGIMIQGVYSPLASVEEYGDYNFELMASVLYRPSAFFFEPSHFSVYVIVYYAYLLANRNEPKRVMQIVIVIIGILLSTAGTGIVLIPILGISYILIRMFIDKQKVQISKKTILSIIVAVPIIIIALRFYLNSSLGQATLSRFINTDGTLGTSTTGRLQSGAYDVYMSLGTLFKIIGCGFGYRPSDIYFPSLYSILYGDGIIGLVFLIAILAYYFIKGNNFSKLLCVCFFALMVGTGVFNFSSIGFYFGFISSCIFLDDDMNTSDNFTTERIE